MLNMIFYTIAHGKLVNTYMEYPITGLPEARKMAGLNQKRAAEGIGISITTYNRYESGQAPGEAIKERICDYFRSLGIYVFEDDVFPEIQKPHGIKLISLDDDNLDEDLIRVDGDQEQRIGYEELRQMANEALSILSDRYADIIRMRFGIDDGDERTQNEIGNDQGVTGKRIHQIETEAMRRMRTYFIEREIYSLFQSNKFS